MKFIDPTYLRHIYDKLKSGSVRNHDFNNLPFGIIGVFHELLSSESKVAERIKILDFFSVWAIIKKEANISLVSKILCWNEDMVFEYLLKYSKWFYVISQNKYKLIHENINVFILQAIDEMKYKKILDIINASNDDEIVTYCKVNKNDHNYTLAYSYQSYAHECLKYVDGLNINRLPKSVVESHHHRAFSQASQILNHKNDFKTLSSLFVSYDELTNSSIIIDREYHHFNQYGIEYIIEKGNSFQNVNLSFIYWVYFLTDFLIGEYDSPMIHQIQVLVNHLNNYLIEHKNIKETILTSKFVNHLNELLSDFGIPELIYKNTVEGIPWMIFDNGYEEDVSENVTEYIVSRNKKMQLCLDSLVQKISLIGAKELKKTDSTQLAKRIIVYINEDKFHLLDSLMKRMKDDLLLSLDKTYDDLYSFDDFVFESFLIALHLKPKHDYVNWMAYFITAKELYRQNFSYFIMLKRIHLNGNIQDHYRQYFFPKTRMSEEEEYMLDEMTTVMYVLGLQHRHSEIKVLLSKFLEVTTKIGTYDYPSDQLAFAYFNSDINNDLIDWLYDHYSQNKEEANTHQLSYVLCESISFLDLISIQLYNENEQSEITSNYHWTCEIVEAVHTKLKDEKFIDYIISGFDTYISVMGSYTFDEHRLDIYLPEENIWRIEWWIMSNFYCAIQLSDDIDEQIKSIISEKIDSIFTQYQLDSNINLKMGVEMYKDFRNDKRRPTKNNFEFSFHKDKLHHLRSFVSFQYNKTAINKIASSLRTNPISY